MCQGMFVFKYACEHDNKQRKGLSIFAFSVLNITKIIFLIYCAFWSLPQDGLVNDVIMVQVFWAFSIYLEAVAILPQLVLLQRSGNVDNLTGQYIFFLGYLTFSVLILLSCSSQPTEMPFWQLCQYISKLLNLVTFYFKVSQS